MKIKQRFYFIIKINKIIINIFKNIYEDDALTFLIISSNSCKEVG